MFGANAVQTPRTRELWGLRNMCVAELLGYASTQVGCVEVPSGFWRLWHERAQSFAPRRVPLSTAVAAQICYGTDRGSPRLVINNVAPAYGTLFGSCAGGREAGHSPRSWLASSLRRSLGRLSPDADVVELVGTFGFDAQIRPRLTEDYLVYPGEARRQHVPSVIPWSDLAIQFEEAISTLFLVRKSNGRKLIPIHLGTLSSAHFPPFYRLARSFGPAFSPDMPIRELLEYAQADRDPQAIRHYPRMQFENVVILRETWCLPSDSIPVASKLETEFAYFRRLRRWVRDAGIPRRVFVTPMGMLEYLHSGLSSQYFRRLHKPFFVDWDDFLSHQIFRRFTKVKGGTLIISEMLPLPEEVVSQTSGPSHCTEYVFEVPLLSKV